MADLVIHGEELALKLLDIARRENRTVEDVLSKMVSDYDFPVENEEPAPGSFAALAQASREAGIRSPKPVDTSERTKEILNSEYADYLKHRTDEQQNSD